MTISSDKKFSKKILKLPRKIRDKFHERMGIFKKNPFEKILSNHKLHGKYSGCNSINITGDYRAVYKIVNKNKEEFYIFITIGTHPELYE